MRQVGLLKLRPVPRPTALLCWKHCHALWQQATVWRFHAGPLQAFAPGASTEANAFGTHWLLEKCRQQLKKAKHSDKPSSALIAGVMAGLASALSVCPVRIRFSPDKLH